MRQHDHCSCPRRSLRALVLVGCGVAALTGAASSSALRPVASAESAGKSSPLVVRYTGKESASNPASGGSLQLSWSEQVTVTPGPGGFGAATVAVDSLVVDGTISYTKGLGPGTPCTGKLSAANPKTASLQVATSSLGVTVNASVPDTDTDVHSTGSDPCSGAFDGIGLMSLLPPIQWHNPANGIYVARSLKQAPYSHHYHGTYSAGGGGPAYSVSAVLTISTSASCNAANADSQRCYVALGDSYSAGVMAPYLPGSGACARSLHAYPEVYDSNVSFWACSGAKTTDVTRGQLGQLRRTTELVSITIGGNDTTVFDELALCVTGRGHCQPKISPAAFEALRTSLAALYSAIHARAPKARIFVLGYPNPLPAKAPKTCAALKTTVFNVYPVQLAADAIPYYHDLVDRINAAVRFATADSRVATYVSTDSAFAGHDVCSSDPYFNALHPGMDTLHPNVAGQHVMATLLRNAAGPPPG